MSMGSLNGMEEHTVTFQSFSKTYAMCGYRVGYAVASPELAEAITEMLGLELVDLNHLGVVDPDAALIDLGLP